MHLMKNISKILDFRSKRPEIYGYIGEKPSDKLILDALELVRKFTIQDDLKITLDIHGLDTVVKFSWNIGDFGIIQYTLHEDRLTLWVLDNNSNVLVENEELSHSNYLSVDSITKNYIDALNGIK